MQFVSHELTYIRPERSTNDGGIHSIMRYQGRLTDWKDDQGFGFVTPHGGGDRAFVHIKAFETRSRRPAEGDIINYEVGRDEKGRLRANAIRFSAQQAKPARPPVPSRWGVYFAASFCAVLLLSVVAGKQPFAVLGFYAAASALAFIAYAVDKSAAKSRSWRTAESTLHLFGLIGGWPGALLAQKALRHKSVKAEFQRTFWATAAINCVAFAWLFTQGGTSFIRSLLT